MTLSAQPPFLENSPEAAVVSLPESIREHCNLVNLLEWIKTHQPTRYSLNARVRQRLEIKAA